MQDVNLSGIFSWFHPIKFATSAFRPGGVYIPGWFGKQPTTTVRPWANKSVALTVKNVASPTEVAKAMPSLSYAIAPVASASSVPASFLPKTMNLLNWGADKFLDYYKSKQTGQYLSKMAQAQLESQKAAQAIAEAQARTAENQAKIESYKHGIENLLSKESLKKVSPFIIPTAIALTVAMILISRKKETPLPKRS